MNLKCASCGHSLKFREERPVRLLAVFRRPKDGETLLPSDIRCASRRCRHCGWINLFEVMDTAIASSRASVDSQEMDTGIPTT